MHSYSQGSSTAARKDNWHLLQNYFNKHSINITKTMIDDVINYKTGAAIPIIHILYKHLTDREIIEKKPINPPVINDLPSFARPTVSQKAKDEGKSQYISSSGFGTSSRKDPLELPGNKRLPEISGKAERTALNSQQSNGVVFRDVQVKSLDKNETRSRLQKSGTANFNNSQRGDKSHTTSFGSNNDSHQSFNASYSPQQRSTLKQFNEISLRVDPGEGILDKLNQLVERELQDTEVLSTLDEKKLFISSFIESVDTIEPQYTQKVFSAIKELLPTQSNLLINFPKEFSSLVSIFTYGLKIPESSPNFEEFVEVFHILGHSLMEKDQNSAWILFEDYALFKIVPLIQTDVLKRRQLLSIIYAFCPNDPSVHMNVIKSLQDKLQNQHTFIHILSHLSHLEEQFSPALLDIYMYYATAGLTTASPKLRATSLYILFPLVDHSLESCKALIDPTLKPMAEDPWWEVKAQLVVLSAKILSNLSNSDPISQDLYDLIQNILSTPLTPHVYTIALSYIAPILTIHPSLASLYSNILINKISEQERLSLLEQDPDHVESLQIGSSCIYDIVSLPFSWDSLLIAQSLLDNADREELDQFSMAHYDILEACINMAQIDLQEHTVSNETWTAVFERSKSYLFAGLMNEETSEFASNVLFQFMKVLGEDTLKIAMTGIMKVTDIIFNGGSSQIQDIIAGFLISLYDLGGQFSQSMSKFALKLAETFALHHAEGESPLSDFILHTQNGHM